MRSRGRGREGEREREQPQPPRRGPHPPAPRRAQLGRGEAGLSGAPTGERRARCWAPGYLWVPPVRTHAAGVLAGRWGWVSVTHRAGVGFAAAAPRASRACSERCRPRAETLWRPELRGDTAPQPGRCPADPARSPSGWLPGSGVAAQP